MPALSHPDLDIQATRTPPSCVSATVSAYDLLDKHTVLKHSQSVICTAASVCGEGWNPPIVHGGRVGHPLSQIKGTSSGTVWQSPPPLEPLIITCEGGLVIFLIILHFISIPPFKTQHENWLPQRSIFIISPRPINYPTLGQGGRAVQPQADPFHSRAEPHHCSALGERTPNGAALLPAENERGKKKVHLLSCEPSNM